MPSPFPGDRICAVVAAATASEAKRQLKLAVSGKYRARTVELRLDYLRSDRERTAFLEWLSAQRRLPCLVATCRRRRAGGRFGGSENVELEILAEAIRAGCKWCDVAIESAEGFPGKKLKKTLAPGRLLISAHDFRGFPNRISRLVRRLRRRGGDAVKIAANCRSLDEVRKLLKLARKERNVVAIPMGDNGDAPRILALREGSALAYAPVVDVVAPGQLSLDCMHRVYKLNRRFGQSASGPTEKTRVYGVIGDPIGHSLSPLMHNAAFAEKAMDAIYVPFRVQRLKDFVEAVGEFGISGFSVTIPHKEAIIEFLDGCDSLAAEIGAVNTVQVRSGNRLYGYNTDYAGVLKAIGKRASLVNSRVLLIGAGGSARAAAFALAKRGAAVFVWARRSEKARALARAIGGEAIARETIRKARFDAIVNCTPIGMYPGGGSPLKPAELNAKVVMDLIYRPMKTELLKIAEQRGIAVISGVEMFVAQGMAQWEIWTGKPAPEKVMRQVALSELKREEKSNGTRMIEPDFQTFQKLAKQGNLVPVYETFTADLLTPVGAYLRLARRARYACLLESVEGGEKIARYTFVGANPVEVFRYVNGDCFIDGESRVASKQLNPLNLLRQRLERYRPVRLPGLPPLVAGAIGYFSYDMVRLFEKLPDQTKNDLKVDDAVLMFYVGLVVFDHVRHRVWVVRNVFTDGPGSLRAKYMEAVDEVRATRQQLEAPLRGVEQKRLRRAALVVKSNMTRTKYTAAVRKSKEYIRAGDVFQVVLSQRFSAKTSAEPFEIYRALRVLNPSPYMYFLKLGDTSVIGSSPEMLVKVQNREAFYRPIAGTRPRGRDEEEDRRLAAELAADPKERAEHIMLVDLGRNDLGRVSEYGSVNVERIEFIEHYSHVMHLVSTLKSKLRSDVDCIDALAACFPAGTVSGAPKVRAMEIIDELEPTRRGIYAGAILYLDFSGNLDSCIAIRTMVVKDGVACVQAGAGIVADSVPEREYQETVNKARALIAALEVAHNGGERPQAATGGRK